MKDYMLRVLNRGDHQNAWTPERHTEFVNAQEIQTGYYLVKAENLDAAIAIAKGNPEFEYSTTARVEVRPLKAEEAATGFRYPTR
jgi:hypothetical protein